MSGIVSIYDYKGIGEKCFKDAEKKGKALYKQNKTYRLLSNCLENPEFKKLFNKHFDTIDNIRVILMFMKLYDQIGKKSTTELNGYQKLSIMDNLIKNKDFRRKICHQASNFMKINTESPTIQLIQK